jgi:hypothetical protein
MATTPDEVAGRRAYLLAIGAADDATRYWQQVGDQAYTLVEDMLEHLPNMPVGVHEFATTRHPAVHTEDLLAVNSLLRELRLRADAIAGDYRRVRRRLNEQATRAWPDWQPPPDNTTTPEGAHS